MDAVLRIYSHSTEATEKIGQALAGYLKSGDILTLDGDLGAGKTAFTRGLSRGLGHASPVASPTFTIVMEHLAEQSGQLPLFHFDVYRLSDGDDFLDSGLDEYLYRGGVSVLEWGKIVADALPEGVLRIAMHGSGDVRELVFTFPESRSGDLESLKADLSGDREITGSEGVLLC